MKRSLLRYIGIPLVAGSLAVGCGREEDPFALPDMPDTDVVTLKDGRQRVADVFYDEDEKEIKKKRKYLSGPGVFTKERKLKTFTEVTIYHTDKDGFVISTDSYTTPSQNSDN